MEAKEAAHTLYNEGYSQKDIANILAKNEKTIGAWVKEGDWDKKRTEQTLQKQTSEKGVWELINYQLKVLKKVKDFHEQELDTLQNVTELKSKLIDKGDIDALQKLFTTIRGKDMEWTQRVKVIREFTEYIEDNDSKLAKDILPIANEYLNTKRNQM